MKLIEITITDDGEHWSKVIKFLGLTVYHRHDYTKNYKPRPTGFITLSDATVEFEADEWPENEI